MEISFVDRHFTILLVEDSYADKVLTETSLHKICRRCEIKNVRSISEASGLFRTDEIDLVLLDLNLPDGYGPQTVADIREINKTVPIIVLTGFAAELTFTEAIRMGANYTMQKSEIGSSRFKELVEEFLYN